jgi:CDP-paratose 2-epimerase
MTAMKTALVTGSAGLVGSAVSRLLLEDGWRVFGLDNNTRGKLFGVDASVEASARALIENAQYRHRWGDVRSWATVANLVSEVKPDFIVHAAGQPSHEWSALHPAEDFQINAIGTMNVLEAARLYCPESPFAFMSTNKVYGTGPNDFSFVEKKIRYVYEDPENEGVSEYMDVDQTLHSPFGASKLAADVMVQEYGRYYDMPTACFRAGCITGSAHRAVAVHGFLAYLVKCVRLGTPYTVYGFKGKQVRDQLHADDLARLLLEFYKSPVKGDVFNIGGGQENSISILEAFAWLGAHGHEAEDLFYSYNETPRKGDHRCYITDLTKTRAQWPAWSITRDLDSILEELCSTSLA